MKQHYKVINTARYNQIHDFLESLDFVLECFYKTRGKYYQSDLTPWFKNLKVSRGRKNYPGNILMYAYLSDYLGINEYDQKQTNRVFGTKFVYVQAPSLKDLCLYLFEDDNNKLKYSKVNLPSHTDLKEFLVPEELFGKKKYNFSYKIDWHK